jgi:signal transduction histidine kinase
MSGQSRPGFGIRIGSVIHSIRFRLVVWFTTILALVLVIFDGFVYFNQARDIHGDSQLRLERKLAALEVTLTVTPNGLLVPQGVLQDTDMLVFLGPTGQVLASHGPIPAQDAVRLAARAQQVHQQNHNSPDGLAAWSEGSTSPQANYIFVTVPILDISGRTGLVILGSPADPFGLVNHLMFNLIAGNLLTLLIALVGGFWLADRAMRPVHTITQAARTIGETDLSRRLNMKSKDELGELADTFDAMLARLQAAFERQRQFVADASHELRTPLTIVNLETSRALSSRRSADEYKHSLSVIRSENDFMTSLVNDLLMLARMDAGQAVMAKDDVDLSDIAVETVERLAALAARNGVTLEAGELSEAHILGDRQYLIQMVSNLVENGIKYTTGENKRVRIETGAADGSAWVRVSDNGPGIAADHLPHLFDRFYRIDESRTRAADSKNDPNSPGGSGLGLSIVQWIAQSHGGKIHVESTVGSGTTFEARFKAI